MNNKYRIHLNANKTIRINIDKVLYVYHISLDIIIDRLHADVCWQSEEEGIWDKLLANIFEDVDVSYIVNRLKEIEEREEFDDWLK